MKPKRGQLAVWGAHTDASGRVTRITRAGFYARYRAIHPSVPGGHKPVFRSRFFEFSQLVECAGFPPSGKVKVADGN